MKEAAIDTDSRRAWVVCAVTFVIHAFVDGLAFSLGVLNVEIIEDFGASRSVVSWIPAANMCFMYVSAIFTTMLTARFGYRKVSFIGAMLSTTGLAISFIATEVYQIFLSVGLVTGLGFGVMYFASTYGLQACFKRRISLAFGISTAGTGVGTLVFAPLLSVLIAEYTWRGALLLCSGIVAQCHILSLFLGINFQEALLSSEDSRTMTVNGEKSGTCGEQASEMGARSSSQHHIDHDTGASSVDVTIERAVTVRIPPEDTIVKEGAVCSLEARADEPLENTQQACCKTLLNFIDFRILRNKSFLLFLGSCFLLQMAFSIPFVFLPDRAVQHGVSKTKGALLITILAASNTVSRVVIGFIADFIPRHRILLVAGLVLVGAVPNYLIQMLTTFETMALYTALEGVTIGVIASQVAVIVTDLMGNDLVHKGIAVLFLIIALSSLCSSPVSGWMFDVTGSYDLPFMMVGVAITLSSLGFFTLPFIAKILSCPCSGSARYKVSKNC